MIKERESAEALKEDIALLRVYLGGALAAVGSAIFKITTGSSIWLWAILIFAIIESEILHESIQELIRALDILARPKP